MSWEENFDSPLSELAQEVSIIANAAIRILFM